MFTLPCGRFGFIFSEIDSRPYLRIFDRLAPLLKMHFPAFFARGRTLSCDNDDNVVLYAITHPVIFLTVLSL